MNSSAWLSSDEDEEVEGKIEYYFDPAKGLDFKFSSGSRGVESEENRRHLVSKGQLQMRKEFKFMEPDELYDPDSDEENDRWVQRYVYQSSIRKEELRSSDALLSCPCCFTAVCLDCVKLDDTANQWRAIEAINVNIDSTQPYLYQERRKPAMPGRRVTEEEEESSSDDEELGVENKTDALKPIVATDGVPPEDVYYKVHCSICNVQVAYVDGNDIFHFWNVFPSSS
eukprot:TRINITY_DN11414_c0_g1_i2.p1 TRINITY_DN11414_c0_g1~~TRINITY_DN11414_c0_g1_i2.p1  ORF type:complete len:227 (+),score=44.78 TRINITY_DN11414_c0_g1_i2:83-763(+)